MASTTFIAFVIGALLVLPTTGAAQYPGSSSLQYQIDGTQNSGLLGNSLANLGDLDGDLQDDFVVGMPGESPNGITGAGSAVVYSGGTGAVIFQLDGATVFGQFGLAVASAGDTDGDGVTDILVGAPRAAPTGISSGGAAFVYSGATGALLFFYAAPGPMLLGMSVDGLGDVDGDGFDDIVIGAPYAAPWSNSSAGSIYIVSGQTASMIRRIDGATAFEYLGWQIRNLGDIDGDGIDDFIASAGFPLQSQQSNFVAVYSGATGATLWQYFTGGGVSLGGAVGRAGDMDGDGTPDFIYVHSDYSSNSDGRVIVRSGATGETVLEVNESDLGFTVSDGFGAAVTSVDDLDQDGIPELAVSRPNSTFPSVWLLSGFDGHAIERIDGVTSFDKFGFSLCSGDFDGNGSADLIIGAPSASPAWVSQAGSAFVYSVVAPPSPLPAAYAWRKNLANEHWYVHLPTIDWASATAQVDQFADVELATVRDLDEQDWIFQELMGGAGIAYVGLTDETQEGSYLWRSGEVTPYWATNNYFGIGGVPGYWYFQEPNNLNNEDYVTIGRPGGSGTNGEWNDADGVTAFGAIFEWTPPPPPSPIVLTVTGTCPGLLQASCSGLSPTNNAAVVYGFVGSASVVAGSCGAVTLDLVQPTLLFLAPANAFGSISFNGNAPASACGAVRVQVLDLAACMASNYIAL